MGYQNWDVHVGLSAMKTFALRSWNFMALAVRIIQYRSILLSLIMKTRHAQWGSAIIKSSEKMNLIKIQFRHM